MAAKRDRGGRAGKETREKDPRQVAAGRASPRIGRGAGRPFEPGQNSHTDETFHRGPDKIPRGSVNLMARVILHDKRVEIYNNLARDIEDPVKYFPVLQWIADRLEGKPTQHVQQQTKRVTIFEPAPPITPAPAQEPPGAPGVNPGTSSSPSTIAGSSAPVTPEDTEAARYVPLRGPR